MVIWAIYEPELLSARGRHILEDPSNEFTLSYAAVWELLNKVGRGRLLVAGTSVADVFEDIKGFGVSFLPITMDHILSAASLPHIHRDPFDRMFIAQALAARMPLVTIDPKIWQYPVESIWG